LQEIERDVVHAERLLVEREQQLIADLRRSVAEHCASLQQTTTLLAGIDTLASFATVAIERKYCEPTIHEGHSLDIVGARHPVIETVLPHGRSYVANDVRLDPDTDQLVIITGPNMSGKSSYLRQVGLITFLAHIGSFVPATSASVPLTDRIFTRVGAQDNLLAGESTFLVEMQESANILHNATRRSLILLDEVGRGTATFDGISIAWAIAEYLHEHVGAKTLFATHYHELTALASTFPRVRNAQVEVREVGDTIVFTHRVVPGHSDHSFGIHVARMAGLPPSVIKTANGVLQKLESGEHGASMAAGKGSVTETPATAQGQLLFDTSSAVDDRSALDARAKEIQQALDGYDVNNMTPMQALQALQQLKERINAR
jgi:DNA mismatch repair protein MutS